MEQKELNMKRPIIEDLLMISLLAVIALFMTACGKSGGTPEPVPAGPTITCNTLAGTWIESVSGSVLVIANDCTFTDSYCGYTANYTVPTDNGSPGNTTITVAGTNGAVGCMSSTPHTCGLGWSSTQLGVVCDGGAYNNLFDKQ
jgi:hypothetical protein